MFKARKWLFFNPSLVVRPCPGNPL